MNVLVAHGDEAARTAWGLMLGRAGFVVTRAVDGADARQMAEAYGCDVMVTPGELPDIAAGELIRALRRAKSRTPVLVLSESSRVEDRVDLLRAGADDVMTVPYHVDELAARLRGLVRRCAGVESAAVSLGVVTLDPQGRTVTVEGRPVWLTPREFQLLEALMTRAGRTLGKEALLSLIYGGAPDTPEVKIVDVFVCKIRNKLGPRGAGILQTIWGGGYRASDQPPPRKGPALPTRHTSYRDAAAEDVLEVLRGMGGRSLSFATLAASLPTQRVSESTLRLVLAEQQALGTVRSFRDGPAMRYEAVGAGA